MTRKKYAYVAHRIDPQHSQNLGDFAVIHWNREEPEGCYHYASEEYSGSGETWRRGRVVNRKTLNEISYGTRTYKQCVHAVERLIKEEEA